MENGYLKKIIKAKKKRKNTKQKTTQENKSKKT